MTRIGISITKSVAFRDSNQEFSNVYYFDGLLGRPSTADGNALIDELTTKEKAKHSTLVSFKAGRIWEQTGDKATTEMITTKALSGTGSIAADVGLDRERTILFRLRAGVDTRGNPVYLRKYFHVCGSLGGVSNGSAIVSQSTGYTDPERTTLAGTMSNMGQIGSGSTLGNICSKKGRLPDAGAQWSAHKYLEHHQLGDQWRPK